MANWASAGEDHWCSHEGCTHHLYGFGSIRGLFPADLHAEKETPKKLGFSHSSTAYIHRHSPSIIRHSVFDYHLAIATSLSLLAMGAWPFFSFVGICYGFLPQHP